MVRPGRRGFAPDGHGLGRPVVGGQPPADVGGGVDGPPDQGVSEPEPLWRAGRADQVQAEQLVKGRHHLRLPTAGRRDRQLRLERVPDHRGALEQPAGPGRQQVDLFGQGGGHGGRGRLAVGRRSGGLGIPGGSGRRVRCPVHGADELFQVEGVAAAVPVQRSGHIGIQAPAHHLVGLGPAQGMEFQALQRSGSAGLLERGDEPGGSLARPQCELSRTIACGDGGAAHSTARPMPGRPSAGRPGPAPPARRPPDAPAAPGRPGGPGSARPGRSPNRRRTRPWRERSGPARRRATGRCARAGPGSGNAGARRARRRRSSTAGRAPARRPAR
jgi:hypothetical protein